MPIEYITNAADRFDTISKVQRTAKDAKLPICRKKGK